MPTAEITIDHVLAMTDQEMDGLLDTLPLEEQFRLLDNLAVPMPNLDQSGGQVAGAVARMALDSSIGVMERGEQAITHTARVTAKTAIQLAAVAGVGTMLAGTVPAGAAEAQRPTPIAALYEQQQDTLLANDPSAERVNTDMRKALEGKPDARIIPLADDQQLIDSIAKDPEGIHPHYDVLRSKLVEGIGTPKDGRNTIALVGDSWLVGANQDNKLANTLQEKGWEVKTVDAKVGRPLSDGPKIIQDNHGFTNADVIAGFLGTNDQGKGGNTEAYNALYRASKTQSPKAEVLFATTATVKERRQKVTAPPPAPTPEKPEVKMPSFTADNGPAITKEHYSTEQAVTSLAAQEGGLNADGSCKADILNKWGSGAFGCYQIMQSKPNNMDAWATEVFGHPLPKSEWTRENQTRIALHMFNKYYDQYQDWRAVAVAWYSGPGNAQTYTKAMRAMQAASERGDAQAGQTAHATILEALKATDPKIKEATTLNYVNTYIASLGKNYDPYKVVPELTHIIPPAAPAPPAPAPVPTPAPAPPAPVAPPAANELPASIYDHARETAARTLPAPSVAAPEQAPAPPPAPSNTIPLSEDTARQIREHVAARAGAKRPVPPIQAPIPETIPAHPAPAPPPVEAPRNEREETMQINAQLARKILDNSNISYDPKTPRIRKQLETIAQGGDPNSCGKLEDTVILRIIDGLGQKNSVQLSSLTRPEEPCGTGEAGSSGPHSDGTAVDISHFNGQPLNGSNTASRALIEEVLRITPANQPLGFGVGNHRGTLLDTHGRPVIWFTDNADHVHIDARRHFTHP